MERRGELEEHEKRLMREYELCQNAAQNLESTIWQTSAVIGIGSIGTFFLVVKEDPNWLVAALIGGLVTTTNCIWWHMAKRWWSVQHTKFFRMRHIEECMGLGQTRYLQYLDALLNPDKKEEETVEMLRKRYLLDDVCVLGNLARILEDLEDRERGLAKNHQREGVQDFLKWFRWINLAAWMLYALFLLGRDLLEPYLPKLLS